MSKLAADLSCLWADLPYLDRFEAASEAGFDGVVVPFPYDMPAKDTQRALMRTGLTLVSISCPPPNYTGGARGFAATVGGENRFQYDLRRSLRYCDALGVRSLRVLGGPGRCPASFDVLVRNLQAAVAQAPENISIVLSIEQSEDAALSDLDSIVRALDAVGSDRVGFAFPADRLDAAEMVISDRLTQIKEVQFGGQGPETLHALSVRAALERFGYAGWVTATYKPDGPTEHGLEWVAQWRS